MTSEQKPRRLLPLSEVMGRVGLRKTAIYDMIRGGAFPKPCKLGATSRWVESEVDAWIKEREDGAAETDALAAADLLDDAAFEQMASRHPAAAEPTCLYRHFDRSGTLLYVGISLSAAVRLSQHSATASWFRDIARMEIEWFPDRTAALRAERHAIKTEGPIHNVVHGGTSGGTCTTKAA